MQSHKDESHDIHILLIQKGVVLNPALHEEKAASKDTVSTDEEDDEVNTDQHSWKRGAAISHDPIIHHRIPVLPSQDLNDTFPPIRDTVLDHTVNLKTP